MPEPISIARAAAEIRRRRLTPLELVEACLAEIGRWEGRLHAWVEVDEAGARRAARRLARQSRRGPLHGIPLGIKDIIDVEGLPTRAGSPLRANHVARSDAPLVAALRSAGAIILGKTVTVEFACFDPSPTRNPWDPAFRPAPAGPREESRPGSAPASDEGKKPSYTPGGSSSGSAVAVAAGMCPGAVGTQTGGSLVRPAAYCGVATCKPTFGRIDTGGIVPVSYHLDHPGPMARRVADLEILTRCLLGAERWTLPGTSAPPRLGLIEPFFMEEADEVIREATRAAVAELRAGGAEVRGVAFPDGFAGVRSMHRRIMAVEAAAYHRQAFAAHREAYGPMIAALLDEGLRTAAVDYTAALADQRRFRRRVHAWLEGLRDLDALITPSTDTTAPRSLQTTGTPKFQAPWSCAGVPVVSIPCGPARGGMPAALQLVGRADGEAALLGVAGWCEHTLGFAGWAARFGGEDPAAR